MGPVDAEKADVKKFLNRILGIRVLQQNLLFSKFCQLLTWLTDAAKREGRYSDGVSDIQGREIKVEKGPDVLYTDPFTSSVTQHYRLSVDRGVSWEEACARLVRTGSTVGAGNNSHDNTDGDDNEDHDDNDDNGNNYSNDDSDNCSNKSEGDGGERKGDDAGGDEDDNEGGRTDRHNPDSQSAGIHNDTVLIGDVNDEDDYDDGRDENGFYISNRNQFGRPLVLLAVRKASNMHQFYITRPNTGTSNIEMSRSDLGSKYRRALDASESSTVCELWRGAFKRSHKSCMHGGHCCTAGMRVNTIDLIVGNVMSSQMWNCASESLGSSDGSVIKISRVVTDDNQRLVGLMFPGAKISQLKERIAVLIEMRERMEKAKNGGGSASAGVVAGAEADTWPVGLDPSSPLGIQATKHNSDIFAISQMIMEHQHTPHVCAMLYTAHLQPAQAKLRQVFSQARQILNEASVPDADMPSSLSSSSSSSMLDQVVIEDVAEVCPKIVKKLTTQPRTMKTFFSSSSTKATEQGKAKEEATVEAKGEGDGVAVVDLIDDFDMPALESPFKRRTFSLGEDDDNKGARRSINLNNDTDNKEEMTAKATAMDIDGNGSVNNSNNNHYFNGPPITSAPRNSCSSTSSSSTSSTSDGSTTESSAGNSFVKNGGYSYGDGGKSAAGVKMMKRCSSKIIANTPPKKRGKYKKKSKQKTTLMNFFSKK